jgi:hypothetical protein
MVTQMQTAHALHPNPTCGQESCILPCVDNKNLPTGMMDFTNKLLASRVSKNIYGIEFGVQMKKMIFSALLINVTLILCEIYINVVN